MSTETGVPEERIEPILSLIQQLKDRTRSIKTVDEETRLECVQVLHAEDYTASQIAQVFNMSDRQIRRYTQKLREQGALIADEQWAREFLGDLERRVQHNVGYLIRLSRDKDTPATEKIQAVAEAMKLLFDLAKLLQSTGNLPLQPQVIGAEVHHHLSSLSEQDVVDLEAAVKESIGLTPGISQLIEGMRAGTKQPPAVEGRQEDNGAPTT